MVEITQSMAVKRLMFMRSALKLRIEALRSRRGVRRSEKAITIGAWELDILALNHAIEALEKEINA